MAHVRRAVGLFSWMALVVSVGASWIAYGQQTNFVGKTEVLDASNISSGRRYVGPGVLHWHGAAPDAALTQVNIGFGGTTRWGDPVSDAVYRGTVR
jgi:hypothetical protein